MEHPLFIYYHSDLQTSAEEIGTNSELIVHLTIIPPLFICFPFIIILYILYMEYYFIYCIFIFIE